MNSSSIVRFHLIAARLTVFCLVCGLAQHALAQAWFDTFEDGDFADGNPVTWSTDLVGAFPGDYDASSGDFVLAPLDPNQDDESMVAWVDDIGFSNIASVRTRASIVPEIPEVITGQGNVGPLMFINTTTVSSYVGVLDAGGNLILLESHGGNVETIGEADVTFNPAETEVYVQMNHDGDNVSLEAWPVGGRQPDVPQVIVFDNGTFTSGPSGIVFSEDGQSDIGIFHYARSAAVPRILDGDVNIDGVVDADDIDTIYQNLNSTDPLYDINEDGSADLMDVNHLVQTLLETDFGDANLDGTINDADFAIWDQNVFAENTGWAMADFNGDGLTDGTDFNIWNVNRSAAAAPVPEPAGMLLILAVLPLLARVRRI